MHGMIQRPTVEAYDRDFNLFIGSLYDSGALPPIHIVKDVDDDQAYFKRNRAVPVLSEDETEDCPVFGNWGTYYEFAGWLTYRAMSGMGNEFQLMVADLLAYEKWSPMTVKWIGVIHGLVTVQELYADKFGHYPADLNKFITSYIRYGEDTVLLADRY